MVPSPWTLWAPDQGKEVPYDPFCALFLDSVSWHVQCSLRSGTIGTGSRGLFLLWVPGVSRDTTWSSPCSRWILTFAWLASEPLLLAPLFPLFLCCQSYRWRGILPDHLAHWPSTLSISRTTPSLWRLPWCPGRDAFLYIQEEAAKSPDYQSVFLDATV